MKTTKKPLALLLTFALIFTLSGASVSANADTQTTDTITVTLKVEDVNSTIVSQSVTLTKEDVTAINNTFTVESGSTEIPVLTSEEFTAAHALGKYVTETSETPAKDLTFSYGSPSYIKGETAYDYYPYWSFRVNNESPADEATGFSYTPDSCPIKDGDSIVFFRQACYDPDAGDWGAYTHYSWFDKDCYETTTNTPVTVTYSKDDGFGYGKTPVANEEIAIYQNGAFVESAAVDENGTASLSLKQAGTYTITGGKCRNSIPELSHASASIIVTNTAAPASPLPATPSPAVPSVVPSAAPTLAPSAVPSITPAFAEPSAKPAAPKKLKVSVKKKTATFTWKKMSGANGYQLAVSWKNKKHFKNFASTKKTTFKKKWKNGTSYVKIRSYQKNNGKKSYGKYSSPIRIVVKK